jgi:arylformamidase
MAVCWLRTMPSGISRPHIDLERTITEMIHVPGEVPDGDYLLELQLPHFINDAAPSRPVLYAVLP